MATIAFVTTSARTSRFEAGVDICTAALTILREYAEDYEAGRFLCEHDEMIDVYALIQWASQIVDDNNDNDNEMDEWSMWLSRLATILPTLWD